jgi:hypothetical protein
MNNHQSTARYVGAAQVFRRQDDDEDVGYWISRPADERMAAQELNRQVLYGYDETESACRIQGVLEVFRAASR